MEIYLVGGAVRDQLLGLPVKERDFVVVGATELAVARCGSASLYRGARLPKVARQIATEIVLVG